MSAPTSDRKRNLIIIFLSILLCVSVGITVWSVFFREPDVILTPDYAPQEDDPNAEKIPGDSNDKLEADEGGGAVNISYSDKVTIDISDAKVGLSFSNPGKSTQDMLVQIVIQDMIIVQSGKIRPGYKVNTLDLLEGASDKLAVGGYDGKFVVLFYDPETGEKAVLNSEIPITVTVKE